MEADCHAQDREAEPRFTAPPTGGRGGFDGGPRGGFGGNFGPPQMGGGGGGRQIYVNNVCPLKIPFFFSFCQLVLETFVNLAAIASLHCRLARSEGPVPSSGYVLLVFHG